MEGLPARAEAGEYARSALILPGDVCTDLARLERALRLLRGMFRCVFYCVGNHELWSFGVDAPDSIERLLAILQICRRIDVLTEPALLNMEEDCQGARSAVRVVPLHSWYSPAFWPACPPRGAAADFDAACRWPACVNTGADAASSHRLGARHSLAPGIADFMARLSTTKSAFPSSSSSSLLRPAR